MSNLSRRKWITTGLAATAGASGLAMAARPEAPAAAARPVVINLRRENVLMRASLRRRAGLSSSIACGF